MTPTNNLAMRDCGGIARCAGAKGSAERDIPSCDPMQWLAFTAIEPAAASLPMLSAFRSSQALVFGSPGEKLGAPPSALRSNAAQLGKIRAIAGMRVDKELVRKTLLQKFFGGKSAILVGALVDSASGTLLKYEKATWSSLALPLDLGSAADWTGINSGWLEVVEESHSNSG